MTEASGNRVAKWIARSGLCSRREAERMIAQGRVAVDDELLREPGVTVDDPTRIAVDGERLPVPAPTRLFRYYKPQGLVVAARDTHGRATIHERLPDWLPRVMPVGRLDIASEGLLLLTNDGELKRRLELPATGWIRRYRVRVYGEVDPDALAALSRGIEIDGVRYGGIDARVDQTTGANSWLTVGLREGKNREVRRVMEHLGLRVNRLMRVAYGPFQVGGMKPGQVAEVTPKVLGEQLGLDGAGQPKVGTAKPRPKPDSKTRRTQKPKHAHRRRTA